MKNTNGSEPVGWCLLVDGHVDHEFFAPSRQLLINGLPYPIGDGEIPAPVYLDPAPYKSGTEGASARDTVRDDDGSFSAYMESLLETERARVRVLRDALEYAVGQVPEMGTVPGVKAALATTAPEGGEV